MDVQKSQSIDLQVEDKRFQETKKHITQQYRQTLEDLQKAHDEDIQKTDKRLKQEKKALEDGYRVEISKQAAQFQTELDKLNKIQSETLKKEKLENEEAFEKIREAESIRVTNFRKKQEQILNELHEKYQRAIDDMNKREA